MAPKKKPEGELKDQRVPIMMSEAELEAIDDWSFKNRIRSRGEAIRRLCQVGLAFDEKSAAILELSLEILRRRTADGKFPDEEPDMKLIALQNALRALEDHSRMVVALGALIGPIRQMKNEGDIKAALHLAGTARSDLASLLEDIDFLKGDTD